MISDTISDIIFDLDGTLVDSSIGILNTLAIAFRIAGVEPITPLDQTIIGPPLKETIASLAYGLNNDKIDQIISAFMAHYDESGYKQTKAFPGVLDALIQLKSYGYDLHIATNKRSTPSRSILKYLGWSDLFHSVYSLDSMLPESASKADLLAAQLQCEKLQRASTLYVGDRQEDWISARSNGLRFVWAQWGYNNTNFVLSDNSIVLRSPQCLCTLIDLGYSQQTYRPGMI